MRSMFTQVSMMSGPANVVRIEVSVPYVAALIADDGKYYMEPKCIEDATERRRYRHRGPTLRSLVRLAVACDSAEELGKKLRRRYERNVQRQGIQPNRRAITEAEASIDRLLSK
jgi:hypothetical protein